MDITLLALCTVVTENILNECKKKSMGKYSKYVYFVNFCLYFWYCCDGLCLSCFRAGSITFCDSYLVPQFEYLVTALFSISNICTFIFTFRLTSLRPWCCCNLFMWWLHFHAWRHWFMWLLSIWLNRQRGILATQTVWRHSNNSSIDLTQCITPPEPIYVVC